ncbi:MAG: DUF481 domain-containing protein, partial [Deltaproteobacteria bacterium]|nr:DUF481 domain-containing protein [Deltaproteobacteria bacterium]
SVLFCIECPKSSTENAFSFGMRVLPMCSKNVMILCVCCVAVVMSCGYGRCSNFKDEAEFAYSDTAGNSDVIVFSARNSMEYAFSQRLEGVWKAAGRYGKSGGEKNVERYSSEQRINYLFAGKVYTSVITKWLTDEFAGIHRQYYIGPALGYRFIDGPAHFLSTEAGANYTVVDYVDHSVERFIEGRASAEYEYVIMPKTRFKSSIEFFYNFEEGDAFNINSEVSLVNSLDEYLAIKTIIEIEYNNKPVPSTLKKTDTVLSVALVFTY